LFVCRDSTRRIYTSRLGVGDRLPAHCSASGKVLLAALPEEELAQKLKGVTLQRHGPASIVQPTKLKAALKGVRTAGFAMAVDEMEDGTLSIAVPLRERRGRTIAAMSVASHRSRLTPKDLETKVLPHLREAARHAERTIGDYQDRMWVVF
jgi:IclR family pca regulon transcriptional regulator